MKWITLPAMPTPKLLSAKPKVRKLGDHRMAFDNANNPTGFQHEPVVQEADHSPVLWVGMRSYEIAQALLKTARDPKARDAITSGLPHRLLAYFLRVEHASQNKAEEKRLRREAKRQAKEAAKEAYRRTMEERFAFQARQAEAAREAAFEKGSSLIRKMMDRKELTRFHNALAPQEPRRNPLYEAAAGVEGARLLTKLDLSRERIAAVLRETSPQELFDSELELGRKHAFGTRAFFSYRDLVGEGFLLAKLVPPIGALVGENKRLSKEEHYFLRDAVLEKMKSSRFSNEIAEVGVSFSNNPKAMAEGLARLNPYLREMLLESKDAARALSVSKEDLSAAEYFSRRIKLDEQNYLTDVVIAELQRYFEMGLRGPALWTKARELLESSEEAQQHIMADMEKSFVFSSETDDFVKVLDTSPTNALNRVLAASRERAAARMGLNKPEPSHEPDIDRFLDDGCPHGN